MSDWLRYQWEWEQEPITVQVDLQYWQILPTLAYSHLIYVACAPKDAYAVTFSRSELRSQHELVKKLDASLQPDTIYVGMIETRNLRQYYYYAQTPSLLTDVTVLCRSQSKLRTTYGVVEEPNYTTYYRFLFPDDEKLQSVENEEFIKTVISKGGDIDLVRRISMRIAFPSFDGREAYITTLADHGLMLGVTETTEHATHPFCVTVYGYSTLHLLDLNRCTSRAIRSAAPFDGTLDLLDADFIDRH